MANAVSKEDVKAFLRDVRIEMDRRNASKFAPAANLNSVKSDIDSVKQDISNIDDKYVTQEVGKGLSSNDFSNADKDLLQRLAQTDSSSNSSSAFDASDIADIFDD